MHRLALVGAGVIGKHHASVIASLSDRVVLTGVADVVVERARALSPHAYPSLASLLEAEQGASLQEAEQGASLREAEQSDVVVVCTPTGHHGSVAIEALEAGKHVIIEKPAEITVERTDEIIAAQHKTGKLVTVISQHRFDPSTEQVLAAIERGELGRITSGIASIDWWRGQSYYDSGDWRGTWELDGGGALMNQGVHTVDLLVAALGRPVEVFAYTGTLAHERIQVEDVAAGVVKFESGALGVLHGTTAAYPGLSARLQVHGDRGSAVIDNDELVFFNVTASGETPEERLMGTNTVRSPSTAGSDPTQLSDAHRSQYLNFLDALDSVAPVRVDLHTNRQSIAVITGAYESARTGKPVPL